MVLQLQMGSASVIAVMASAWAKMACKLQFVSAALARAADLVIFEAAEVMLGKVTALLLKLQLVAVSVMMMLVHEVDLVTRLVVLLDAVEPLHCSAFLCSRSIVPPALRRAQSDLGKPVGSFHFAKAQCQSQLLDTAGT